MLVLSRKIEEVIVIADDIRVKILGIHGNTVKLGVCAPRDVPVDREETWQSKEEDKRRRLAKGQA